jgi:hypothetical protein
MVNPVDIGLRIAQALDGIGIKLGSYIGKSSNVKKAMFGGKPTMFKPNALQALRGDGKNFDDALKLIEEEAQFIVNATDAEKMAFLNNINDYKDLGGPLKKDIVTSKKFEEGIGSLKDDIESLQSTAKTMKEDAEKGLKSAEEDLKVFLETGGNPLKKKEPKYLGGSMHEEGQLRTAIRTFLKNEYKNGRINLDETDKFRVMEYSPMLEDDPIKVFKKIYGDEAYKKAGTFPGAFETGESFNHYESIFRSKMGEDILKVKDKKYVGDGKLVLTEMEEVKTPTPNDDDMPFAEGGRAAFKTGKMVMGVQEIIKLLTKKMSPMGAMKELNKIIGKKGDYSRLTQKDVDDIVEATNDFVFQRDPDNLFVEGSLGKNVDDVNRAKDQKIAFEDSIKEMEGLGATQTAERFKLKQKYPGITDSLLDDLINDPDPNNKARALAALDEAMTLQKAGKSEDEIIEILKSTPKKEMATGGRAGFYLGGQSGQSVIEPDLSDIGHGSDALMSRTRMLGPNAQATTSTGLNYLLGEDNDNTRVPFNDGLLVPPAKPYTPDMFEKDSMTLLKGMYGTGPESNTFLYNKMIEKGNMLRKQGVERETVIEIIRNNKDKINAFLEIQKTSPKSLAGLADGGRAAFGGGGTMGASDKGYQGGGRDKEGNVSGTAPGAAAVGGVDDRGTPEQNQTQMLVNAGYTPKQINEITNPSVLGRVKNSPFNNPFTRGIARTAAYMYNPAIAGVELRQLMQAKDLYDRTRQEIMDPNYEIDDITLGLTEEYADGGIAGLRQGYGGGGGVNLARRGFLKILGATAAGVAAFKTGALKLLGKTATTKAVPYKFFTAEAGSGAPAWFEGMVNKVLADGVDITKKAATMDGQTVKSLDTPTGKVDVTIDRMGNVDVNYQGSNTAMGEGVDMRYVVNEGDELTRGKPMDEFEAVENIPEGQMSGPDDYNVEMGENLSTDVSGLYSDTSELAELGGQKPLIKDISTTIKKKQTLKKMNENPDQFASDNLPDYDY